MSLLRTGTDFLKGSVRDALVLARNPESAVKLFFDVFLYRNAVYLVMSSAVSGVLSFAFWILVARLYPAEAVGLNAALLSAAGLLAFVGTLGLGFGIIRFLPDSNEKSRLLNSSFTYSGLAAIVAALIFVGGISTWSPELVFLRERPFIAVSFILFVATAAVSAVVLAAFVSFRRTSFHFAYSAIFSLLKLGLGAGLTRFPGVSAIFFSWGIASSIALLASLLVLLPLLLPRYLPIPSFRVPEKGKQFGFSLANYVGEALASSSPGILPLMVLSILGAEANAYFYVSWALTSLLLGIPMGISFSLFAEGSHREERLGNDLRRSLKLSFAILVPAIPILALLGDRLLMLFGEEYSVQGARLLWLLAPAALPTSLNYLYLSVARVQRKLGHVILVNGAIAIGTLVISYVSLTYFGSGIFGAGVAWLASQMAVAAAVTPKLIKMLKGSSP